MHHIKLKIITYIIHYTPLTDRLKPLLTRLGKIDIIPNIITENNIDISPIDVKHFTKIDVMGDLSSIFHILCHHINHIQNNPNIPCSPSPPRLSNITTHPRQLSIFYKDAIKVLSNKNKELSLQHYSAFIDFLKSNEDFCLILEDDSVPLCSTPNSFSSSLLALLNTLQSMEEPWFIDVSDSLGLRPPVSHTQPLIHAVCMGYGQTRCASAYIINRTLATLLCNTPLLLTLPIDWLLSCYFVSLKVKTYWSSEPLFAQGSQAGHFTSNSKSRGSPYV